MRRPPGSPDWWDRYETAAWIVILALWLVILALVVESF